MTLTVVQNLDGHRRAVCGVRLYIADIGGVVPQKNGGRFIALVCRGIDQVQDADAAVSAPASAAPVAPPSPPSAKS
jgi:hypothetical protein